jgi:hypothetical protein
MFQVRQEGWDRALYQFKEVDNLPLVLCSWISGSAAKYMEQLSDEEVKHRSVLLLNQFIGKAFNVTVPAPDLFLRYGGSFYNSNCIINGNYEPKNVNVNKHKCVCACI